MKNLVKKERGKKELYKLHYVSFIELSSVSSHLDPNLTETELVYH